MRNSFIHKIEIVDTRYKYLVLGREESYFVMEKLSNSKYTVVHRRRQNQDPQVLVDNIFMCFTGKVFQQIVGIPIVTNFTPSPIRSEFIQALLSVGKKQHLSSTSHVDTSMTYCLLITNTLRITSIRWIPMILRSLRGATVLLSTCICFYLSGGGVQYHTSLYNRCADFNFHFITLSVPK